MISRILAWWRTPARLQRICELLDIQRREQEAVQKDIAAIRAQGEAVRGMKRAIDVLITENQKYRDRVKTAGDEWNTLCHVLGLPVPCTILSAVKILSERKTNVAR